MTIIFHKRSKLWIDERTSAPSVPNGILINPLIIDLFSIMKRTA
jgi:hypothetical protein